MSDETITIYAARIDRDGAVWFQTVPDGRWFSGVDGAPLAEVEEKAGPTRPVRIVTTDPGEVRELLDDLSGLTQALVDEKHAHAKTRDELDEARSVIAQMSDESPAGLSEQEIRARALAAAAQMIAPAVAQMVDAQDLPRLAELSGGAVKLALRFADLIRTGEVRDATS